MKVMTAQIAGGKHYRALVSPYSMIELAPAPCPEDGFAVAVLADGQQVGYLEAGLAPSVRSRLIRGSIVFAAPDGKSTKSIFVYLGERGDRLSGPAPTIVSVESSSGNGAYAVDLRRAFCTCPAGRFSICKHKAAFFETEPSEPAEEAA
jgi:hypothetical protein